MPPVSTFSLQQPAAPARWVRVAPWVAQVAVALVLAQTLYFKFTYAPETQVIFADRGGRLAATFVGIVELCCAVLLLRSRTAAAGAALALAVISGAILTHLTSLGIQVLDPATGESDGGLLFGLAVFVAVGAAVILLFRRRQLFSLCRQCTALAKGFLSSAGS